MMTFDCASHKAEALFRDLIEHVTALAGDSVRCDRVERELFRALLDIGRELMKSYFASVGDGDLGEQWERGNKSLKRQKDPAPRTYHSIFGVLKVSRAVYAVRAKQKTYAPLDQRLGFPEGEHSYLLQDILQRFCVKDSFEDSVLSLKELFGLRVSKLTAEKHNQEFGASIEEARETSLCEELDEEEAEILVATADGKGVPMRNTLEESRGMPETPLQKHHRKKRAKRAATRSQRRLSPGHGKTHKQMAWIAALYSTDTVARTADEVLGELDGGEKANRPKPVNKRIQASMTDYVEGERVNGQDEVFQSLAAQVRQRDPDSRKTLICLMDGQGSLWDRQTTHLPHAVAILDIFHVSEKLWEAAYCFHGQTSREADRFVEHYFRLLLEGKVLTVIRSLRARLRSIAEELRKKLKRVIRYFDNNQSRMQYDEYLAKGYPIASGVIEGGCRHLVKDRMERTGMRWKIDGAQTMLNTRCAFINGDWNKLFEQHIQRQQDRLYSVAA